MLPRTALRMRHWKLQVERGISHVPSGDFSFYDHVLDTACMLGVIPTGYGWSDGPVSLATYFALARGSRGTATEQAAGIAPGSPALEMTKWFDTNYHYLVPRLTADQRFRLTENRPLSQFREARRIVSPDAARAAWPGKLPYALQGDGRLRSARPVGPRSARLRPGAARTGGGECRLGANRRAGTRA